jgi:hypothetical protein
MTPGENVLQKYARAGLIAIGIVYCLLGLIVISTAIGYSSHKGDKAVAFKLIKDQPFGKIILAVIAVCLLGYVTYRFFQAFRDTDKWGNDMRGLSVRIGFAGSGIVYTALTFYLLKLVFSSGSSGDSKKIYARELMEYPGGRIALGIIAAFIIGQGFFQIYKGISKKFMEKVELYKSDFSGTFQRIGIVGFVARGIVLCIIGYFFFLAAYRFNAQEAGDTGKAFDFIRDKGGNILMGIVAVGLVAYGVFMFVRARHEKIRMN